MSCCTKERLGLPKVSRQLKDVAQTLANVVAHGAKTGQLAAEPSVVAKRVAACQACDRFTGSRCRECGCFVAAKAALAASTCPLQKW